MPCNCGVYIDCQDKPLSVDVTSENASYEHSLDYKVEVTNLPIDYLERTYRKFSTNFAFDRDISPGFILTGCTSDGDPYQCNKSSTLNSSLHCTEHCIREVNTPYYLDRANEIFVYHNQIEELKWDISSDKTAYFREKWGNNPYHKLCIPNTVKTKGTETFYIVRKGVSTTLITKSYEYNPFPVASDGGATWGLYGNVIVRSGKPETPNVACILIFPTVGKQAMPYDADVIYYGFYDYNATEGGFNECSLPKDDGGKDYFYPYWCRQMPEDKLWRSTADSRYEAIYNAVEINLAGTTDWIMDNPKTYDIPFGSFAIDSQKNTLDSMLLRFSERCDGEGAVINMASFGDVGSAIYTVNKIPKGAFSALYPVTPL